MKSIAVMLAGALVLSGLGFAQGAAVSTTERGALQRLSSEAGMAEQILDQNPPEKFTAAHANFVRAKIAKCEAELPRCPPASHPQTVEARARIDKIKAAVEARAGEAGKLAPGAKKVTAAIQEWVARLEKEKTDDPLAFQDPQGRTPTALRTALAAFEPKLAKAGNPEHPDAKEAAAALADAKAKFEAAFTEAKNAVASLGDWKAELVRLAETFDGRATLIRPVNDEKMEGWISSLPAIKANIDAAIAYDQKLRATLSDYGQSEECRIFGDKLHQEKDTFNQNTGYWENEFVQDVNSADSQELDLTANSVRGETISAKRAFLTDGVHAAKMQLLFYRDFKKDPAAVSAAEAKAAELTEKIARLDANADKLIDTVRMEKDRGTAEMKKLAAKVTQGADFQAELKREGSKLLRVVVVDPAMIHNNTWEWSLGKYIHRDFDGFSVHCALKLKSGRVEMWETRIRFARSDWSIVKKNVWTYTAWQSHGPIREANVFK